MDRTPVTSSNIRSIGYNPETNVLEIEFKKGGVYQYDHVPPHVHSNLMGASSHGHHFWAHIKGVYQHRKM